LKTYFSFDELYEVVKGPDFPTGCTIYDKAEVLSYFATGKGRIIQRAKADIVEEKGERYSIVITEIPYMVTISSVVEKIAELVNDKKIKGISEIRDESSKGGVRIVVEIRRDADHRRY
jgi:DNA gyrase subunit A